MFLRWCKEVRHHIQIFMTHTFPLIYFHFPRALTPMRFTTRAHIPSHQFALAVMRHGEYQLSLHLDVQGVIFRVCFIPPFPPYHCISLSSHWLSLSVFISHSGEQVERFLREAELQHMPASCHSDWRTYLALNGRGRWCGVCSGNGQLSGESWWAKTESKLTRKSWQRKRAERSVSPVPAHLSA